MGAEKILYVPKRYDVRKNKFTCFVSGHTTIKKWSDFAFMVSFQKWETTLKIKVGMPHQERERLYFMRRVGLQRRLKYQTTLGGIPSVAWHKKHGVIRNRLSKLLKSCHNDKYTIITKMNGFHLLTLCMTIGSDPTENWSDAKPRGRAISSHTKCHEDIDYYDEDTSGAYPVFLSKPLKRFYRGISPLFLKWILLTLLRIHFLDSQHRRVNITL